MMHRLINILSVDDFFNVEETNKLSNIVYSLTTVEKQFGKEIENFNMVSDNCDEIFSKILGTNILVDKDRSGVFRIPERFIHFEEFDDIDEWIFVVAIQQSTFDVFEHQSGSKNALDGYKYNYRNLFEWNHKINYQLDPGQGVLFRPWLFHSFDCGLIQVFRLKEKNA